MKIKITKEKTKRILLGILLCGCFAGTAHADYEYTWTDYTDRIKATDAMYTYTDAGGETHEITYKTVELPDLPGTEGITVATDINGTDNGSNSYTTSVTINGTGHDFTVHYTSKDNGISNTAVIGNDVTGKYFLGISGGFGTGVYNESRNDTSGATIGKIEDSYFIDNTSMASGDSAQHMDGAILNHGYQGTATIGEITGSWFIGNTTTVNTAYGAAINNSGHQDAAVIGEVKDCYFIGNTVSGDGGAIYNYGNQGAVTIGEITGGLFVGNSAAASGGAIYNYNDATDGTGNANAAINGITGSYFIENSAGDGGGAISNYVNDSNAADTAKTTMGEIKDSYFMGNAASGSGGAIHNSISDAGGEAAIEITGITGSYFQDNTAENGGAISNCISDGESGTATIKMGNDTGNKGITGSYFIGNTATSADGIGGGGAIYNYISNDFGTTATIDLGGISGSYFVGNTAKNGNGGAVYNYTYVHGRNVEANIDLGGISGSYFVGNSAKNGGAIYSYNYDNIIYLGSGTPAKASITIGGITESYFVENSAEKGGAIYTYDYGGAYETEGIGEIKSSYFVGNSADNEGGAIYNRSEYAGTVTIEGISGSCFVENSAENGGAISNISYAHGNGKPAINIGDISKSSFAGNTAEENGGAIYNYADTPNGSSTITIGDISESSFEGNSATGEGGAIYNYAHVEEGAAKITIGDITGSYFIGNSAAKGGAIYNDGWGTGNRSDVRDIDTEMEGDTGAVVSTPYNYSVAVTIGTIEESTFEGNSATGEGGAIYNSGSSPAEVTTTITGIRDSTFTKNTAGGAGGAIYNYSNESGRAIIGDITGSTFSENTAGGAGGAIYNSTYSTIGSDSGISGSTFNNNSAANYGGGIYNAGTIKGITDTSFNGNKAVSEEGEARGGGLYNAAAGTIDEISLKDLTGNHADGVTGAYGGAVYDEAEGSVITVTGSVSGNYATASAGEAAGGAFCVKEGDKLTVTGTEISGNYVSAKGEGNTAFGGAVYNDGGNITVTAASLSGNHAVSENGSAAGGAIYNAGTVNGEGTAINLGDVIGNYAEGATGAKGGAIYDTVSTIVTIDSASGNYVRVMEKGSVAGGVICLEKAGEGETSVTVTGDVTGNHAETANGSAMGGAFYNGVQGTLTIGGDITGNYAISEDGVAWGGAVYNAGTLTIAEGAEISGNHAEGAATAYGGAIYNDFAGETGDITADFSGNYAASGTGSAKGGAIYNIGSIGTVSGAFTGNYAASEESYAQGGAVYNTEGGEITSITAASLSGNYAESESSYAEGGAIDNENPDTAITVTGNITDNHIKGATNAAGGAIYSMGNVTVEGGAITGNYAEAAGGFAYGGAIINSEAALTVDAAEISGNYVTSEKGVAKGGVIYDEAEGTTSVTASGAAKNNYAKGAEAYGGAVYNGNGALAFTVGSLENNYAEGTGTAAGGAIYDKGTDGSITVNGDVTGNYAKAAGGNGAAGGAIFYDYGTSGDITVTGAVSGNYAESSAEDAGGGAIYTESEDVNITIKGDVTDNYATTTADGGSALGGAIYSQGTTDVTGAITGNYVEGSDDAGGGAIYNEGTLTVNATSVENNHAISSAGAALAGAIYTDSEDSVINVTGNVTGNYVKAEAGEATGGAIYSLGTTTIEGDVTDNYAEGADVQGGAIYAGENSTVNIYGNITGNYAKGDTALGGAIYNADGATVNIYVENKDSVISGNYVESGGEKEDNLLYGEAGSVTNFNLTDATLRVDDGITGDTGFEVNIKGNGTDATTLYMYNDILDSNLSFAGTTLNTINNEVKTYSVNQFTVAGDFNMVADVDLASESMDRFVTNGNSYGDAAGSLTVSGMNLISDADKDKDKVGVYFAEPGLKEYVKSDVKDLPGNFQTTVYAPINEYSVAYDKNYDGSWGADGGYFVFEKTGNNNPEVLVPEESEAGAIAFMGLMFDYVFEHSDYYMKLPSETRLAIREKAKAARAAKLAAKNGTTAEEESANIDAERAAEMESREGIKFYGHENVLPLYDQNELTRPGVWVRAFSSFETVPFKHQFTSRNKSYGLLVGIDTDFKEDSKGWGNVFTVYAGYDGINQSFSGNSVKQYGGLVGVTETFYKKNFYTAWTAAGGSNVVKSKTMYGRDKEHLYMYGIASRSGWNLEYDGGKLAVLPTFTMSYSYATMNDYTNAAGVRLDSGGMHAVQLNPNVKWIRNYDNGWQPYLTLGEIWTVASRSSVRANDEYLDTLTYKPYTEYGLGVQKRWANNYDGYAEFLGHAGGRRGFLVNLGFRWTFN